MASFWMAATSILATISVSLTTTPPLLIISIDGFGWDYMDQADTPNFDDFIKNGVKAEYMLPVFPTLTFPTHYSMATGLFPESHGIVGNRMYDPVFNETFSFGPDIAKWWEPAVPIWVNAVNHGLKSGIYFWVGSNVSLSSGSATTSFSYDFSVPNKERIDTVVDWLNQGYELVGLYISIVDWTGHKYGPGTEEVREQIVEVDGLLGYLMKKLESSGRNSTNVILVSDHGMSAIDTTNRLINLTLCADPSRIRYSYSGVQAVVFPTEDADTERLYEDLRTCHDHLRVYRRRDVPERWHYRRNRRIGPIVIVADEGWYFSYRNYVAGVKGYHGYDNKVTSMRAIFMARGPSFASGRTIPPVNMVDLYPLMCHLLAIAPAPNNGSLQVFKNALNAGDITRRTDMAVVFPTEDADTERLYEDLRTCHDHLRVYRRRDVPERWHYRRNRRIGPIVIVADEGWYFSYRNYVAGVKGYHGYDNKVTSMRAIFMARGPSFASGRTIPPVNMVDLYPLMCHLLAIAPAPNNGSLQVFKNALNAGDITRRTDMAVVFPTEDADTERLYEDLRTCHDHLRVYRRRDVPERWHYRRNRRIGPIVIVADEGWYFSYRNYVAGVKGYHGYDNKVTSMRAIFMARGPSFASGRTIPPVNMVDLYPLMCHLLAIAPAPNNGSLQVFKNALNAGDITRRTDMAVVFPTEDADTERLYEDLRTCHDHLRVYRRRDVPERWHYRRNRRIGPIVIVADEGWYFSYRNYVAGVKGYHGYDNKVTSMRAIFMARGPSFASGRTIPPVNMVDLYPLMCHLLAIAPAPNNGSLQVFKNALNAGDITRRTDMVILLIIFAGMQSLSSSFI